MSSDTLRDPRIVLPAIAGHRLSVVDSLINFSDAGADVAVRRKIRSCHGDRKKCRGGAMVPSKIVIFCKNAKKNIRVTGSVNPLC